MNFLEMMTRDDWILLGIVIVILAIPSVIKPLSLWLGKRLGLVKSDAQEEEIHAMQEVAAAPSDKSSASESRAAAGDAQDGGEAASSHG